MKVCLNCKEELKGRPDKKFCNAYCKSNYHYEFKKKEPLSIYKKIDKQLKLNRKILLLFNKSGKSIVRKEKLIAAGFNPKFFTHYWKNSKGKIYLFCYDIGFLKIKDNGKTKYILVNYQDQYMGKI